MAPYRMLIIDAFGIYNELDMLNYRLNVLAKHVDYFILVESTHTFNGVPKPLFFQENRPRFAPFLDRIIHVVIGDVPCRSKVSDERAWENERYQREVGLARGLAQVPGLTDDDYVISSDLDEIVNPNLLKAIRNGSITHDHITLEMDMYYYNMTNLLPTWYAPSLIKARIAKHDSCRHKMGHVIPNAGWHLSYFGDSEFIQNKIVHFAHQEFNSDKYTDLDRIRYAMENGVDLFGRPEVPIQRIQVRDNERLPPRLDLLARFCIE